MVNLSRKDWCSLCGFSEEIVSTEDLKYAGRNGSKEVKTCVNCDALKGGNGFQRAEYQRRYDEAAKGTVRTPGQPSDLKLTDGTDQHAKDLSSAAVTNFDKDNRPTSETVRQMRAERAMSTEPSMMRQRALDRLRGFLWGAVTVAGMVLLLVSNGTLRLP